MKFLFAILLILSTFFVSGQSEEVIFHGANGKWKPAVLDDRNVRFYQLFPINFICGKYDFDYLELKRSMLYWEVN